MYSFITNKNSNFPRRLFASLPLPCSCHALFLPLDIPLAPFLTQALMFSSLVPNKRRYVKRNRKKIYIWRRMNILADIFDRFRFYLQKYTYLHVVFDSDIGGQIPLLIFILTYSILFCIYRNEQSSNKRNIENKRIGPLSTTDLLQK